MKFNYIIANKEKKKKLNVIYISISHSYVYILTLTFDSITYIHYSITNIKKGLYDQEPDYGKNFKKYLKWISQLS